MSVSVPKRGDTRALLALAVKNAVLQLASRTRSTASSDPVLRELKASLGLSATPTRIEGYDISNIQGSAAVGSMVTFERGYPLKSGYRHFKIREVQGADDYAMMREVLSRRLAHLKEARERRPDLIMVDGGRGQVSAARSVMEDLGVTGIRIVGLAKRNEEIYLEGRKEPLKLSRRSPALRLLERVRDEAHRFAIEYHRKLRNKSSIRFELDDIAGVGEARRTALLVEFGSLEALRGASAHDIAGVPGIGERLAKEIYRYLHKMQGS